MTKQNPRGFEAAVGVEIRRRRGALGWSLRRLADEVGLDFGYVGKIERGEAPSVGPEVYRVIARALGVSVSALFAGAEGAGKARRAAPRRIAVPVVRRRASRASDHSPKSSV